MIRTFTEYIKEGKNFAFTKFGDSELFCMQGREGKNGDEHPFSLDLGFALTVAYREIVEAPESYLAEWTGEGKEEFEARPEIKPTFIDYETLLPTKRNRDLEGLREFYNAVKESKRKKIYIAPARSQPVIDLLGIDEFIEVPLYNCWSNYEITHHLLGEAIRKEENPIVLFSCTMLANVLIGDYYDGSITCLDCGSAFDPYCGIQNREGQMTPLEAKQFFHPDIAVNLLTSDLSKVYFVHIKNPRTGEYYSSYDDYFRLVHLSGFQECDIDQVNPHSNNTYIFTLNYHGLDQRPIPETYFPKNRTARYILHQLERFNIIDERFDEIWLYDKSMKELSHPKAKYVILGGDKNFMEPVPVEKIWDFYHLCYLFGRREKMVSDLGEMGFNIAPAPIEWRHKNIEMQRSKVGLALHQHEHSLGLIEPLRLTVFSCMKLPILAEKSDNPFPYYTYSYEMFLANPALHELTNWQDNWELMTEIYPFKEQIINALR